MPGSYSVHWILIKYKHPSSDEEDDEELEEKQAAVIAARRSPSPVPGIPNKSAVTCIDPSDDDFDIEILEHLSTPVGPKAEQPPVSTKRETLPVEC